jgi:hypothetical protein
MDYERGRGERGHHCECKADVAICRGDAKPGHQIVSGAMTGGGAADAAFAGDWPGALAFA